MVKTPLNNLAKGVAGIFKRTENWSEHLTVWMDQYEKKLIAIACSILNDSQLALDCVQEGFIKAGLNAHKLQRPDRVFSWLARIVVNECMSNLRSRKRETVTDSIEQHGYQETYPSEQDSEIWRMVNRLSDKLRIPVTLFYYHDVSLAEITSMLGLNEATCRVRLHRARTKLREMMEGENNE